MSTAGQAIGGVVGAAAGFMMGGPAGAMYGAQIGMTVGGYLDPPKGPTMEGPRISDLAVQTSTYGAFIPRCYGTIGQFGNVFWLENNKLKEVVKKTSSGGKGGGSSATTKTYTYFATLAVGVCVGPVDGIRRIWAGPTLVYDAGSGEKNSIISSNKTKAKNFVFYLGTDTQMPDSRMQADLGSANVPAYRGLCYVVIKDFALAKYGNAIPPFKFEVITSGGESSNIIEDLIINESVGSASQIMVGNPYDGKGLANYVIYRSTSPGTLPIHIKILPDGSRIETTLAGPAYYSVVSVPAANYRKIEYAFNEIQEPTSNRLFWGYDGIQYSVGHVDAQDQIRSIADYSEHLIFATLRSHVSASTAISIERIQYDPLFGSYAVSQLSLTPGNEPTLVIYGEYLLAFKATTGGVFTFTYYDIDDLSVVDSFDITVTGAASDWNLPTDRTGAIFGDTLAMMSGNVMIRVDLIARTADLYTMPTPAQSDSGLLQESLADLGGVIIRATVDANKYYNARTWAYQAQSKNLVPIAEIIEAECNLSGLLTSSDIDVSTLTDSATGYRITKIGSLRNSIEPLQAIWPFDVVQSGYKIKFQKRGLSSIATIDAGELGVGEQLRQSREMDSQMPNSLVVNYLDRGRNYDSNQQQWERPSTGSVNVRTMEIPAVLSAAQASRAIEKLGYLYWLERTDFGPFSLPPTYGHLEPGDVITLIAEYATYDLRLTTVNYKSDGSIECSARLNNASTYTASAESDDVDDSSIVALAGASAYKLLDIPVIDETLQNAPGMACVMCGYSSSWAGGTLYRSADNGQTWVDLQSFSAPATFGIARGTLAAHAGNLINIGSSLTVDILAGTLSGVTESQMLNGSNMVAYGAHGRWEIMRFQNASLNADGSYTVSGLWRGDKGTEWATGLHVSGDSFVLLDDPDGAFIGMPTELIGVPRYYRGITTGEDIESDTTLALTYAGVNLECLSPVHASGVRASGDLTITWKRRTRIGGAWRDGVDATLGEATEAYEIDVMSGSTVKRTITATSQTATYTSAQQTTDFGSAQSSITVRIYQMSAAVGRGYKLEVTL